MGKNAEQVIKTIRDRGEHLSDRMADEIRTAHRNPNNDSVENIYARKGVVLRTPAEECEAARIQNERFNK